MNEVLNKGCSVVTRMQLKWRKNVELGSKILQKIPENSTIFSLHQCICMRRAAIQSTALFNYYCFVSLLLVFVAHFYYCILSISHCCNLWSDALISCAKQLIKHVAIFQFFYHFNLAHSIVHNH